MISDSWFNLNQYLPILPQNLPLFKYLENYWGGNLNNFSALPLGKSEILPNKIYVIHEKYQSQNPENKLWESHRRFVDIQIITSGKEIIKVAPINDFHKIIAVEYSKEKDVIFYKNLPDINHKIINTIILQAGSFAVFYPQDAHLPGIHPDFCTVTDVEKIVFKLAIE